jgi:hypothetical protein
MGYVSGVRAAVVADLAAALPDLDVWEWPRNPDVLLQDCVVVNAIRVRPGETAAGGTTVTVELYAVSATTVGAPSEDDLDALLDGVLIALDSLNVEWTQAERAVFGEKYPCYRIEMEV